MGVGFFIGSCFISEPNNLTIKILIESPKNNNEHGKQKIFSIQRPFIQVEAIWVIE